MVAAEDSGIRADTRKWAVAPIAIAREIDEKLR